MRPIGPGMNRADCNSGCPCGHQTQTDPGGEPEGRTLPARASRLVSTGHRTRFRHEPQRPLPKAARKPPPNSSCGTGPAVGPDRRSAFPHHPVPGISAADCPVGGQTLVFLLERVPVRPSRHGHLPTPSSGSWIAYGSSGPQLDGVWGGTTEEEPKVASSCGVGSRRII